MHLPNGIFIDVSSNSFVCDDLLESFVSFVMPFGILFLIKSPVVSAVF